MKKRGIIQILILLITLVIVLSPQILAHDGDHQEEYENSLVYAESMIASTWYSIGIFLFLIAISVMFKKRLKENHKKIIFFLIILIVILNSLYLIGGSVYINVISETKGPVHWHADFEIDICGNEIDIKDPELPLNRIGTPLLHEHNDFRIHVEGVVIEKRDVSLGAFFHAIGGKLTKDELIVPTNGGMMKIKNGDLCNQSPSKLYVFLNGELLEDHTNYVISPYETVPPGDILKFVFSEKGIEEIDKTTKDTSRERRI